MEKKLFVGSGGYFEAQRFDLMKSLMEAFHILDRIQRPHWDDVSTDEEIQISLGIIDNEKRRVEEIAKSIAEALTGKKVKIL